MKQILDFLPLLLFFIIYKLYGMQAGVATLMIASTLVIVLYLALFKKLSKVELFTYLMVMLFGAMTLYWHKLIFLQWKVTILYTIFIIVLLVYQWRYRQSLLKKMLGQELQMADTHWNRLTYGWIMLFALCASSNLLVTYFGSDDLWASYKTFVLTGVTLVASILSGLYLYKHSTVSQENSIKEP